MKYAFNIHVENVFYVTVDTEDGLDAAISEVMGEFAEGNLKLSEPNINQVEFWNVTDDDFYEVGSIDCWGNDWRIGEEQE